MDMYVLCTGDGYESSSTLGVFTSARGAVQAALDNMRRLDMTVVVCKLRVDEIATTEEDDVVVDCLVSELPGMAAKVFGGGV
jgi:hypothetical protein